MSKDYFGSPMTQFENGCQMGLRCKLAVEFLKAPGFRFEFPAVECAKYALDLADEIITQSEAAGYLIPLPDDNGLSAPMRRHIERATRANAYQQVAQQRIAAEEQPQISIGNGVPADLPGMRRS